MASSATKPETFETYPGPWKVGRVDLCIAPLMGQVQFQRISSREELDAVMRFGRALACSGFEEYSEFDIDTLSHKRAWERDGLFFAFSVTNETLRRLPCQKLLSID